MTALPAPPKGFKLVDDTPEPPEGFSLVTPEEAIPDPPNGFSILGADELALQQAFNAPVSIQPDDVGTIPHSGASRLMTANDREAARLNRIFADEARNPQGTIGPYVPPDRGFGGEFAASFQQNLPRPIQDIIARRQGLFYTHPQDIEPGKGAAGFAGTVAGVATTGVALGALGGPTLPAVAFGAEAAQRKIEGGAGATEALGAAAAEGVPEFFGMSLIGKAGGAVFDAVMKHGPAGDAAKQVLKAVIGNVAEEEATLILSNVNDVAHGVKTTEQAIADVKAQLGETAAVAAASSLLMTGGMAIASRRQDKSGETQPQSIQRATDTTVESSQPVVAPESRPVPSEVTQPVRMGEKLVSHRDIAKQSSPDQPAHDDPTHAGTTPEADTAIQDRPVASRPKSSLRSAPVDSGDSRSSSPKSITPPPVGEDAPPVDTDISTGKIAQSAIGKEVVVTTPKMREAARGILKSVHGDGKVFFAEVEQTNKSGTTTVKIRVSRSFPMRLVPPKLEAIGATSEGFEIGPSGIQGPKGTFRAQQIADETKPGIGRPELANPGTTAPARNVVSAIDETRKEQGVPDVRPREVARNEANERLAKDREGEKSRVLELIVKGESLNEVDTVIAKTLADQAALQAAQEADPTKRDEAWVEAFSMVNAYRESGTEQARAFGARADEVMTPLQRLQAYLGEALLEPNPKVQKKLDKLNKRIREGKEEIESAEQPLAKQKAQERVEADTKRKDKIIQQEAKKSAKAAEALKAAGIDLPALLDKAASPQASPQPTTDDASDSQRPQSGAQSQAIRTSESAAAVPKPGDVSTTQKIERKSSKKSIDQLAGHPIGLLDIGTWIKIRSIIRESKGSSNNWIKEFYYNAILSAPKTQIVNFLGNTAFSGWELFAQRFVQAAVNLAVRAPDGARLGEIRAMARFSGRAIANAFNNALLAAKHEAPILEKQINLKRVMAGKKTIEGKSKLDPHAPQAAIPGVAGRVVRSGFGGGGTTGLLIADEFAKGFSAQLSAAAIAYRAGKQKGLKGRGLWNFIDAEVANLSSETWAEAVREAERLAFQEDLDALGQGVLTLRDAVPGAWLFIPFVRTPYNIFKQAFKKTPLGLPAIASRMARGVAYQKGYGDSGWQYTRGDLTVDAANQLVGFGLTLLIWGMMSSDDDNEPFITGSTPLDPGQKDLMYRTAQPQSIRLGDTWVSYARIEPFATQLSFIVDSLRSVMNDEKSAPQKISGVLTAAVRQASDKTFLQGITDIMDAISTVRRGDSDNIVDGVRNWASDFSASWVPNIARHSMRSADDSIRESRILRSDPSFWNKLSYKALPLPSNAPPPKVDMWGRDITKHSPFQGPKSTWLWRMLSPVEIKKQEPIHIADQILLNWNNQNPGDEIAPRPPMPHFTRNGVKHPMSAEEYHDFMARSGANARARLEKLLTDPKVMKDVDIENPSERLVKKIQSIVDDARERERKRLRAKMAARFKGPAPSQ